VDGGWRQYGGHEYKLLTTAAAWDEAKAGCTTKDGYISCPETRAEWEWLKGFWDSEGYGGTIWLGGSDADTEGPGYGNRDSRWCLQTGASENLWGILVMQTTWRPLPTAIADGWIAPNQHPTHTCAKHGTAPGWQFFLLPT